jgi:hypothetical protein
MSEVYLNGGWLLVKKHHCWTCGSWKLCPDISGGVPKLCDRWSRRIYQEILDGHGKASPEFKKRLVQIKGWSLEGIAWVEDEPKGERDETASVQERANPFPSLKARAETNGGN